MVTQSSPTPDVWTCRGSKGRREQIIGITFGAITTLSLLAIVFVIGLHTSNPSDRLFVSLISGLFFIALGCTWIFLFWLFTRGRPSIQADSSLISISEYKRRQTIATEQVVEVTVRSGIWSKIVMWDKNNEQLAVLEAAYFTSEEIDTFIKRLRG